MKPKTSGKMLGRRAPRSSAKTTKSSGKPGIATAATRPTNRPERYKILTDPMTGKERKVISFQVLRGMMVESTDKLPMPAEFRAMVGKGKKRQLMRLRKEWVGFGWTGEDEADGTEPLLVLEEEDFQILAVHGT
jgi:hypothetical protein